MNQSKTIVIRKKVENIKLSGEKEKMSEKKIDNIKKEERNNNQTEKNLKIIGKNNLNNHFFIGLKKKEIKNYNNKNKILSTSSSNKKMSQINR